MESLIPLFLMGALLATFLLGPPMLKARRRQRLQRTPFSAEWETILFERLRFYPRMPELLRQELRRHIPVFLAEKHFYGRGWLEISEAIRVLIAAQACLLILNRKTDNYRKLQSILASLPFGLRRQPRVGRRGGGLYDSS